MGKGKRIKASRTRKKQSFHSTAQEVLTRNFQKAIRESEFWPQMVAEFGEEKAEALLKECKGELKQGMPFDETGDNTTRF